MKKLLGIISAILVFMVGSMIIRYYVINNPKDDNAHDGKVFIIKEELYRVKTDVECLYDDLKESEVNSEISFMDYEWTVIDKKEDGYLLLMDDTIFEAVLDDNTVSNVANEFDKSADFIKENLVFLTRKQFTSLKDNIKVSENSWWLNDISSVKKDNHNLRYYVVGSETKVDRGTNMISDNQNKGEYSYSYIDNDKIGIRPCLAIDYTFSIDKPVEYKETKDNSNIYAGEWLSFDGNYHLFLNGDMTVIEVLYNETYTGTYRISNNDLYVSIDYGLGETEEKVTKFNNCLHVGIYTFVKKGEEPNVITAYTKNIAGTYKKESGGIWAFTKDGRVMTNESAMQDRWGYEYYYVEKDRLYILNFEGAEYDSLFYYEFDDEKLVLKYDKNDEYGQTYTKTDNYIYDDNFNLDNSNLYKTVEDCMIHYFGDYDKSRMSILVGPRNIKFAEQNGGSAYEIKYIDVSENKANQYFFMVRTNGVSEVIYNSKLIYEGKPLLEQLPE